MSLRTILARRDAIGAELRAFHDAAAGNALAADAQARWDTLSAEAESLAAAERRQAMIEDMDRRAGNGTPVGGTGDARFESLAAQVTITDVIRAQIGDQSAASGRAREVSAELARRSGRTPTGLLFSLAASGAREERVFTTTNPSGGPGSNLIQTTVSPNLIDRLRERCVVRQMGATVLGGLVGNLSIPRLKASASATWFAENSAMTVADPQTDSVLLTPKHCGGIVSLSRNMIMQPSLDVTTMVENDLMKLLAVALDQAALVGGGSNQPNGILAAANNVTLVSSGTNGGAITWANIVNLIGSVDQSNALAGSLGFVTNAKVVKAARQALKTSQDTSSNFVMTDPTTLAGYPLASTQNVPATFTKGSGTGLSALIFGDWSSLVIGFWSEIDILVNPYDSTGYAAGNVLVRAAMTADVELKHAAAFAAITDIIAP